LTQAVIGVICALRSEARCLGRTFAADASLERLADGTLVAVTGIGAARATAGAEALRVAGAQALLSFGMAGGLDPALRAGDVVLPAEVVTPQGAAYATSAQWRAQLYEAARHSGGATCGRLVTSDSPVLDRPAKEALFRASGAVAVDMESAAVGRVATDAALPFMALRAVIDPAAASVPQVVLASSGATGQTSALRLLVALGRRPQDLGAFLPLLNGYRMARSALRRLAASGALQPPPPRATHVLRMA
jgi:adenosylhomocysteine nucleosidase